MRAPLLLLLACLSLSTAPASAAPRIERIEALLGSHFRPEVRYPIAVTVHGGPRGFAGSLELDWQQVTLRRRIELGPGAARRVWFYPVAMPGRLVARVRLTTGGEAVVNRAWQRSGVERVYPIQRLVGVVGASPGQLSTLRRVARALREPELLFVPLGAFPDQAAGLEALDLLLLCRLTSEAIVTEPQAAALAGWLSLGGGLVVNHRPLARLPWLRPLVGGAEPLRDPTATWASRWLAEFEHGCGRGLLFKENLLRDDLPEGGTRQLWERIDRWLLAPRRRPTSPGQAEGAERLFPPPGQPPRTTRKAQRLLWGLMGTLLVACGLSLVLSPRPRVTAVGAALVISLAGGSWLGRTMPQGKLDARAIGLLELGSEQSHGALQRWIRVVALRPVSGTLALEGPPPLVLGGDVRWTLVHGAQWQLPLELGQRANRLLTTRQVAGGVGPLTLTRQSALAPHLLNAGGHELRHVAVLEKGKARLLGHLEPDGALQLGAGRGRAVSLSELADLLFADSPNPLKTLEFLLEHRRTDAARLLLARVDLPAPALGGDDLLPPGPTRTLLVLPWP